MTSPFVVRLEEARREAESRIAEIDRKIKNLQGELEKAHEERKLFSFMAADFEQKLRSVRAFENKDAQLPRPYRRGPSLEDARRIITQTSQFHRTDERPPTMRDMVISILSVMRDGLDVNEMIEYMRVKFGAIVPRTSLSPQLSRMKAEDELILDGDKWRLHPRMLPAQIPRDEPQAG